MRHHPMGPKARLITAAITIALGACDRASSPAASAPAASPPAVTNGNHLSMRIDGELWQADHDVFGAFHPAGYERALVIAGARGPKDANEQAFNINLYAVNGIGTYTIRNGNNAGSAVQLANYTPDRFLFGSMMGFEFNVDVTSASSNPTVVEATFSGTLTGNDSSVLKISDGRFRYAE